MKESTKELNPGGANFWGLGLHVSEKFTFLLRNFWFCFVWFSNTDLPKIIVLSFLRGEFHRTAFFLLTW